MQIDPRSRKELIPPPRDAIVWEMFSRTGNGAVAVYRLLFAIRRAIVDRPRRSGSYAEKSVNEN